MPGTLWLKVGHLTNFTPEEIMDGLSLTRYFPSELYKKIKFNCKKKKKKPSAVIIPPRGNPFFLFIFVFHKAEILAVNIHSHVANRVVATSTHPAIRLMCSTCKIKSDGVEIKQN